MSEQRAWPKFKYHPNLYDSGVVEFQSDVCQCCGEKTDAYITSMYCVEDVDCICLDCVASGKAAKKFHGSFIQDVEKEVSDPAKNDELLHRTPGYISWQGEYWLTCCDDYCAFLGDTDTHKLKALGVADEVFAEYDARGGFQDARRYLTGNGSLYGYLFQCLHCGKYHLWVDAD